MIFLIIVPLIVLLVYLVNDVVKPHNFPPGPRWLPIVGNLPLLKKLARSLGGQHHAFMELSRQYKTNVLGLKLGKEYVTVVYSYPLIKQVLTNEEFEARPDNFFMRLRCMGTKRGITATEGDLWNIQRNFVVRHLRNLGFGKKPMESLIRDELSEIISVIESKGSELQIGKILAPAVINILWALVTGTRIPRNHPQLDNLLDLLETRSKLFDMSGGTLGLYPWLRFIIPEKSGYNLIKQMNDELRKLFLETIEQHEKDWYEGRCDDVIYSFLTEMKNANGHSSMFTNDQLIMVCLDLFIGGSQTTSNTLDFAFLFMLMYPEIQRKIHQCLDENLVKNAELKYTDRNRIPYIEAVLLEVERYRHVVPVSGPRRAITDTVLDGYFIPKNTTILINNYSVHHDQEYWKDPHRFRPERFLDEHGKLLPSERLLTFGLGRRRCLGEALAKNCLFFFFVEILRRYELSSAIETQILSGVPKPGITLSPENYRVRFTPR